MWLPSHQSPQPGSTGLGQSRRGGSGGDDGTREMVPERLLEVSKGGAWLGMGKGFSWGLQKPTADFKGQR